MRGCGDEAMSGEPVGEVADAEALNPQALGFMCGLEIHQQLATGKLHSRQSGELYDVTIDTLPETWPKYSRRLRAASGEGGKIDVAARFEAKRNRTFVYVQSPNSGLVELDDAPPLQHDPDALDIALTLSSMLSMKPVPLMQAMRKTVVDGSNTSGFQRTTLVSTDGELTVSGHRVGIDVLCLEEDSARKLDTISTSEGQAVIWNLDRLGIPLIEIATAPDVVDPEHAKSTAKALGGLLRDTRRVRRGLGSIRQDLNVSIASGDRVEIKGCQDIDWIPRIIKLEMARQLHFYRLANELRNELGLPALPPDRRDTIEGDEEIVRTAVNTALPLEIHDVTEVFESSTSKMIQTTLASNGKILLLPLPYLAGRLGSKVLDTQGAQLPRLGRELAGAARLAGVKGIFHSDELPAYGIESSDMEAVQRLASLSEDTAFVLCAAPHWQAELALESVHERALLAWHRIPQEVRNVVVKKGEPEDGTTAPMRPLPGGARMYPETDVPPFVLPLERWEGAVSNPPLTSEQRNERLQNTDLSADQSKQILARELDDELLSGIEGYNGLEGVSGKALATLLLTSPVDVPPVLCIAMQYLREQGLLAREAEFELAEDLVQGGAWRNAMDEAAFSVFLDIAAQRAGELGLEPADAGALKEMIEEIVNDRIDFVKERGMAAIGPLMGIVMSQSKGVDGKEVSQILRELIQQHV